MRERERERRERERRAVSKGRFDREGGGGGLCVCVYVCLPLQQCSERVDDTHHMFYSEYVLFRCMCDTFHSCACTHVC